MVIAAANLFRPLKRKKTSLVKLGRLKLSKFFLKDGTMWVCEPKLK